MSMNRVSIDIGPTATAVTRGTTIYAFDPNGNRFETSAAATMPTPTRSRPRCTMDEVGAAVFYHDRKLNDRFLTVVS
jgi:catechol 2,3-dioxygenase